MSNNSHYESEKVNRSKSIEANNYSTRKISSKNTIPKPISGLKRRKIIAKNNLVQKHISNASSLSQKVCHTEENKTEHKSLGGTRIIKDAKRINEASKTEVNNDTLQT